MNRAAACLMVVIAGLAGCGYKAKVEYANADHQLVQADDTSHQHATRLQLEVAADLDREPPKATEVEVAAAGPPSPKRMEGSPMALTIFLGGVHYHGDTVIKAERHVPVPQPTKMVKQQDERCERLRREHEERLAEWLTKFN